MESVAGFLPFVAIALVAGGMLWWRVHRRRVLRDGLVRLAARDGLTPTARPCGLDRGHLAGRCHATPRGDRRYGLRHGIEGTAEVELDGGPVTVDLASFEWWCEERVRTGKSTSYQERRTTVALARLPVAVPGWISLRPEHLLGRVGLTRGDQQLESEEFNRRFHVDSSDRRLTLRFLDAAMQHRLLTRSAGRSIHLQGDLFVLGGSPDHRDGSLPGVIGELPAARQDLTGLLRAVPAQLWRSVTARTDADPGATR